MQTRNLGMIVFSLLFLVLSFFTSLLLWFWMDITVYDNAIRLSINREKEGKYPRMELDLSGTVLFASKEFRVETGSRQNVQEMIQRDHFSRKKYPGMEKIVYTVEKDGDRKSVV